MKVVRNPECQPSKNVDSVKACQNEFRQLSVGPNGTDGTSRLKPQPLQHDESLSPKAMMQQPFKVPTAKADQPTHIITYIETISMATTKTTTICEGMFDDP